MKKLLFFIFLSSPLFADFTEVESTKTSFFSNIHLDSSLNLKVRRIRTYASLEGRSELDLSYYGFSTQLGLQAKKSINDSWNLFLESDVFATKFTHRVSRIPGYLVGPGFQFLRGSFIYEGFLYYQYEELLFHSYGFRLGTTYKVSDTWSLGVNANVGEYPTKVTGIKVNEYSLAFVLKAKIL